MNIAILTLAALLAMPAEAQPGRSRCCMGSGEQTGAGAPVASQPVVQIDGVISEVHISPGQRMPYLEVKRSSEVIRLYLGAMHYLIAENFNPKAGQRVTAKGYKMTDSVIAIEVTLPTEKKTLKLRDEKGRPLWSGGRWRTKASTTPAR
jgi:hypothetical protein